LTFGKQQGRARRSSNVHALRKPGHPWISVPVTDFVILNLRSRRNNATLPRTITPLWRQRLLWLDPLSPPFLVISFDEFRSWRDVSSVTVCRLEIKDASFLPNQRKEHTMND